MTLFAVGFSIWVLAILVCLILDYLCESPTLKSWRDRWTSAEKSDDTSSSQSDQSDSKRLSILRMYQNVTSPSPIVALFENPVQPSPPSPLPEPPSGPIIGWRAWWARKTQDSWLLRSLSVDYWWTGPTARNKTAPRFPLFFSTYSCPDAEAGFHACRNREYLLAHGFVSTSLKRSQPEYRDGEQRIGGDLIGCYVVGTVECHGAIDEKEFGWLSQAQTIQKLYVPVEDADLIRDLEQRYQCEVVVALDLRVEETQRGDLYDL